MRKSDFHQTRSMAKEDVLATIRDCYRFSEQLDPEAEPGYDLSLQSTVADWRNACDLLPTRSLGHALNSWFNVYFSDADWRSVLEPAKTSRLEGVCELIASQGQMPAIKPFKVLGAECQSAGAFLAIRSALSREGIPVAEIRPSTPLSSVACEHLESMVSIMSRISPDVLPVPQIHYGKIHRFGVWCGALGLLALVLSPWTLSYKLPWIGVSMILFSVLALCHSSHKGFKSVGFGEMRTFRDLSNAVLRKEHHQP